jgi:AraC-like DNA-binding protein
LLMEMRMGQALRLLQSTDMSIVQVSFSVGYESPSKFAGRFKSRFGFAPSSLRLAAPF